MYDENAEDEATITVIATGLDAHGANTPVERAMKDFTNYKQKVPAPSVQKPVSPMPRTAAPAAGEAAAAAAPQLNIPNSTPVYRPAHKETQINIPDFLKKIDSNFSECDRRRSFQRRRVSFDLTSSQTDSS